eukprot:gene23320-35709_t
MADAVHMNRVGVALTAALTGVEIHVSDDFAGMYASSFLQVPMESILEVLRRPPISFDQPVPETDSKRLGVAMLKLTAALTGVEIHVSDDFVKMYASSFLDVPTLSMESVLEVLRRPTINFDLPVPEVFESLQRFAKGTSDPEIDTQTVLERFESRNNNGVGKDLDNALSGADDEKLKLLKIGYDVFNRPPSSNDDKRPPCTEDDVYRLLSSRAPGPVSATQ